MTTQSKDTLPDSPPNSGAGTITAWVLAARPKTLTAAAAPVILGAAVAYLHQSFDWSITLACLVGAMLIQIGTNFVNDYYDFKKGADKQRLGPTRAVQAGLLSAGSMKTAFIVTFAAVFIPGGFLIYKAGWPILVIGVLSLAAGYMYTGGPFPFAYNGLGDIFVLIFFGPVAVAGTYYAQSLTVHSDALWAGVGIGLLAVNILVVNNLRDIETDRVAGKNTLAVRFGVLFTRLEYSLCLLGAIFCAAFVIWENTGFHLIYQAWILIFMLPAIGPTSKVWKLQADPALNPVLGQTAKLLIIYSVLVSASLLSKPLMG